MGLGRLLSSPGTGSGTSAGLGCPEGPIVRRSDRFASVKAFVLPEGAGPCMHLFLDHFYCGMASVPATYEHFLASLSTAAKGPPVNLLKACIGWQIANCPRQLPL